MPAYCFSVFKDKIFGEVKMEETKQVIKLELTGAVNPYCEHWKESAIAQLTDQYEDREMIKTDFYIGLHFIGDHKRLMWHRFPSTLHHIFERILAMSKVSEFGHMNRPEIQFFCSQGNPKVEIYIHV
jgi:hypothetical protein